MRRTVVPALLVAVLLALTGSAGAAGPARAMFRLQQAAAPPTCAGIPTGYWPAGDSITEALQSSTGDGWRGRLADRLNALPAGCSWYYTGQRRTGARNMVHDGWGGKTTNEIATKIPTSFGSMAPASRAAHVVIWGTGTNDAGNRTADQMISDMRAAALQARLAGPDVKMLIQQPTITPVNNAQQQAELNAYDDRLPALAAELGPWVRVVDMRGVHIGPDRVHPDDQGYAEMGDRLIDALTLAGWLPGFAVDQRVTLLAQADYQFVTAEQAGTQPLQANRLQAGAWERFQIVDLGDGDVALWADINGRYVAADNSGNSPLIANRTAVGPWERFQLTTHPDGAISLKARINGMYVSAADGGNSPLIANRAAIGTWEKFDTRQQ